MMKQVLLALLCLAPVARAEKPVRDIFGVNMCAHLPAAYHLQKGDAACPRILNVGRDPMDFVVPELGIRASFTNAEYLSDSRKGALGGENGRVYRRVGQIDCAELGLDCQGQVDISRITTFDWTDDCREVSVTPVKRYSQSGLWTAKVIRNEAMNCHYRQ